MKLITRILPLLLAVVFAAISGFCDDFAAVNSNPLTITRKGLKDIGSALPPIRPATFSLDANKGEAISTVRYTFGTIDDLSFEREGNRLRSVSDAASPLTYAGAADFVDGADEAEEYAYDANGNMTMDLNRGIDEILYNDLNLPAIIRCSDGTEIKNYYAADGRLLKREIRPGVAKVTREVYIADFIFNQNAVKRLTLKQTNTPTGYITRDGQVHSFLKDYQGNIRQVISENGAVEQESHYYPYGMLMGESTLTKPNDADANRYRFSGKEYVTAAGLNLYDFSARYFAPDGSGLWGSDPMQSDYAGLSPTAYCAADPINFIDPSGCALTFTGEAAQEAFEFLRQQVLDLGLTMDEDGSVSYKQNKEYSVTGIYGFAIREIIGDSRINVVISATNKTLNSMGGFLLGGAFMGNTYDPNGDYLVVTSQEICLSDLKRLAEIQNNPQDYLHEITESYIGGQLAIKNQISIQNANIDSEYYNSAHSKAYPQISILKSVMYDEKGNVVIRIGDYLSGTPVRGDYLLWKQGEWIKFRDMWPY